MTSALIGGKQSANQSYLFQNNVARINVSSQCNLSHLAHQGLATGRVFSLFHPRCIATEGSLTSRILDHFYDHKIKWWPKRKVKTKKTLQFRTSTFGIMKFQNWTQHMIYMYTLFLGQQQMCVYVYSTTKIPLFWSVRWFRNSACVQKTTKAVRFFICISQRANKFDEAC